MTDGLFFYLYVADVTASVHLVHVLHPNFKNIISQSQSSFPITFSPVEHDTYS